MFNGVVSLIVPFIALAIISVMIDKFVLFLEGVMKKIPHLPNYLDWWTAYVIVLVVGGLICWQGNFDLFMYLNIQFRYVWEGWGLTALVLSGGSAFVRTSFSLINMIPSAISGINASIRRIVAPGGQTQTQYTNSGSGFGFYGGTLGGYTDPTLGTGSTPYGLGSSVDNSSSPSMSGP